MTKVHMVYRIKDDGLRRALDAAGNANRLAVAIGVTRAAVYHWVHSTGRIPAERVADVSKALGIPKNLLRPDIF